MGGIKVHDKNVVIVHTHEVIQEVIKKLKEIDVDEAVREVLRHVIESEARELKKAKEKHLSAEDLIYEVQTNINVTITIYHVHVAINYSVYKSNGRPEKAINLEVIKMQNIKLRVDIFSIYI